MALLRNTSTDIRQEIPAEDAASLLAKLWDESATTRRLVARDLARFPEASHRLAERLEEESDSSVREAIITSLAALADITAVTALIDCLHSEDAALRNDAIEGLKTAGGLYPSLIQEALQDGDPDVRILAIGVLESLRHPDVEQWLIDLLDHDAHLNVCACAVDLLCEIGSGRAIPALERCSERFPNEEYLHFAVGLAIQRLQGEGTL
ncbi:HEAT repeat domain-containing protein [Halomonas sp. McH1-25]|uniref:HEAT repeat domain-containing protein n=1 Tax=unclassified Halomonas TaxID=2609666 RepID=UPI001EF4D3F9|nr:MULTISPECIES: HEAT repeat domain-containing protein [unclassified Halomonas]MCG7601110.1 HEAT repeat domain-containing protein [Halomonas sp. McH1-25]MCP1342980.1 HEAT repeat domain-containing protein [Halomonas sp. FL8]MCP1360832.1 HEAT repeat domain-containing protein [Halomonas sp. BBD45]MCP1364430.1 HEAT repeat domain-containing protein [Halomonas sp. BBD48]